MFRNEKKMKRFFFNRCLLVGSYYRQYGLNANNGHGFCFTIYIDSMEFLNDVIHSIKYVFLNLGTEYFIFSVIDKINKKKNIGKKASS